MYGCYAYLKPLRVNERMEVICMTDDSKEKVIAERQDDYQQKKEDIIKEALEEHEEKNDNDKQNV